MVESIFEEYDLPYLFYILAIGDCYSLKFTGDIDNLLFTKNSVFLFFCQQ